MQVAVLGEEESTGKRTEGILETRPSEDHEGASLTLEKEPDKATLWGDLKIAELTTSQEHQPVHSMHDLGVLVLQSRLWWKRSNSKGSVLGGPTWDWRW